MTREILATIQWNGASCSLNDCIRKELIARKIPYYNTMNGDIYAEVNGTYFKVVAIWKYGSEFTVYVDTAQRMYA